MTQALGLLLPQIADNAGLQEAAASLAGGGSCWLKIPAGLRPAAAAALSRRGAGPALVVCPNIAQAEEFAAQAADYLAPDRAVAFPDWDSYPFEAVRPDVAAIANRALILERLLDGEPLLVSISVTTLMQKLPVPDEGWHHGLELRPGDEFEIYDLAAALIELGYVRQTITEQPGEFAVRGGVVDIFPGHLPEPVRLDFFGSEIESIKIFDVSTQRSKGPIETVKVPPCLEYRFDQAGMDKILKAGGRPEAEEGIQRWLPLLRRLDFLSAYLPAPTIWFFDEPKLVDDEAARFFQEQEQALTEGYAGQVPFAVGDYYVSPDNLRARFECRCDFGVLAPPPDAIEPGARPATRVNGRFPVLEAELKELKDRGLRTVIVYHDIAQRNRLAQLVEGMGLGLGGEQDVGQAAVALAAGRTAAGFIWPDQELALFGHEDIFPRHEREAKPAARSRRQALVDFSDLAHGELLVHEIHGIAVFAGLAKKTVLGKTREYLLLDYAAGDRLYLPTEQVHRVSRYIAPEGVRPEITRLGKPDWQRTVKKARNSVKKLAFDLMALYAERAEARGHAFAQDTPWQAELEASFPYEATPDQVTAINDVKRDMEAPQPMDRLICGDVGYGKTEVALRAAFKAINDGKQVMMLVPTTILAQQHFMTFSERFAPFPVEVDLLSRFVSPAAQKEAITRIKGGSTDLLIGTHRLLQKDVKFKDLGLVIVDEEQRFGVNHKEKLRQLRRVVDVLTLSATPIPRTMQMSISGVRDLSLIETPPEGRRPVMTHIGPYDPVALRGALRRELARGGQVFYVHNRVETIDRVAARVKELVPEATVLTGHGQMSESALEKVMLRFLDHRADILVSTTIIENGIDIPLANTLVVEDADRLGLAQLYQLRGRVGRGNHRGFAYFTYNQNKLLTETAVERLKTIADFTELGSGYKVALRDLEIRGAGNILGAEQHGHMISVGFDLYCRMLRQEVERMQGKVEAVIPEVLVELPVNAYLPESYIDNENLRLEAYRSIAGAVTDEQIEEAAAEIADRFGPPPPPVKNILDVARLRLLAAAAGIKAINFRQDRLVLKGTADEAVIPPRYQVTLKPKTEEIVLKIPPGQPEILKLVIGFINAIMR